MSKHNYSQYSNKNKNYNKPKVEETTTAAPVEPEEIKMESFEPAIDLVAVETVETVALPTTVTGTVANCSKLNVRAKPATDAEVLTVLNGDSEVEIDPARSTSEWLKITTAAGIEGFCMRKFVNAKL